MNGWMLLLWILGTLVFVSAGTLAGRRYGPALIISLVAAAVVTANVLASKIVQLLYWPVPAGVIVYSISFYLTDVLSEFYGKETARKAVWAGLLANLLYLFSVWVVVGWPAAEFWPYQEAYSALMGLSLRVTMASQVAYLASQLHDVWAYDLWRRLTGGRYLFVRNNLSTLVSQFLDTVLFITLAFYGHFALLPLIAGQYLVKVMVALLDTPFLYLLSYWYSPPRKEPLGPV